MAAETAATITSQACERVYRSTGDPATVTARLRLSPGARLAWLPQETILFDGGRLTRTLEADLDDEAELIAVEAVLFGRQAMGEQVRQGALHDRWRIRRHGKLIFADDLRIDGAVSEQLAKPAIWADVRLWRQCSMSGKIPVARSMQYARRLALTAPAHGLANWWFGFARDGLALRRRLESVLNIIMAGRKLPRVWEI
jgi:urease accessory protein